MTSLLLVEDDPIVRRALTLTLGARGYQVTSVGHGVLALESVRRRPFDVIVLDLGLPDMDGLDVLSGIRTSGSVPVVVLSARHDQSDKVRALDAGADDYVTKPFGIEELLARLRATVRRARPATDRAELVTEAFTVDFGRKEVRCEEAVVHLTPTEWALLETLALQPGIVVAGADLLRDVWGPQYASETNYLRVYVAQLRKKLEPDPSRPRYLITSPGLGYRFET